MKQLHTWHNRLPYTFEWYQSTGEVLVIKNGQFAYTIKAWAGFFVCSCPGNRYHHKCWHTSKIGWLKQQPTIEEPWAEWAEEARRMGREKGDTK